MRKSIFIHDQVDVMNHINANNISEDIHMLVEEIREKVRLKRHK
jgi:enhancing lycopene biosynthesis protein 2